MDAGFGGSEDLSVSTLRCDASVAVEYPHATAIDSESGPALASLPVVELLGARLHAITEKQCIDLVLSSLDRNCSGTIGTMNLDHLRRFIYDEKCARLYSRATLLTADGMPLIWASLLQRTPLPERVTGSNLVLSLTAAAASRGRSIFLLGGDPGAAEQTAAVLSNRHPGLRIAGVSGRPKSDEGRSSWGDIARILSEAKPDIVYVALGSPKQEELIDFLRETLPGAWWLGVGIAFSFVAGIVPRAPLWMQRSGLEWLHRLLKEPRRLARRYLIDGIPFAAILLRSAAIKGLTANKNLR